MRFGDELVDPGQLDVPEPSRAPTEREVDMAGRLVESLHGRFKPGEFKDPYRERVLELVDRKAKGEEIELPAGPEAEGSDDLMAPLEASMSAKKKGEH